MFISLVLGWFGLSVLVWHAGTLQSGYLGQWQDGGTLGHTGPADNPDDGMDGW